MMAGIILVGLALYEAIIKKIQLTFMHVIMAIMILALMFYLESLSFLKRRKNLFDYRHSVVSWNSVPWCLL